MSQFYISKDNEDDVRRCNQSRNARMRIMITGLDLADEIRPFEGIVQSVEYDSTREPGKRWRVTIRD